MIGYCSRIEIYGTVRLSDGANILRHLGCGTQQSIVERSHRLYPPKIDVRTPRGAHCRLDE
jgi:hypothetical protein